MTAGHPTTVDVSDDGSTIVFVRGSNPNRDGWIANPSHDPAGAERGDLGGELHRWRADPSRRGERPTGVTGGKQILYVKDGQINRVRYGAVPATPMDKGEVPFIREWGSQSAPRLVARRIEDRLRQRPRRSLVHRFLDAKTRHRHVPISRSRS